MIVVYAPRPAAVRHGPSADRADAPLRLKHPRKLRVRHVIFMQALVLPGPQGLLRARSRAPCLFADNAMVTPAITRTLGLGMLTARFTEIFDVTH